MNLRFLFPIPLLTSPLKGEELNEVCDDYPPLQGEGCFPNYPLPFRGRVVSLIIPSPSGGGLGWGWG